MASSWRSPIPSERLDRTAPFRRVAVVGLGVMGGSLARALSAREGGPSVSGWSPEPEERRAARGAGVVRDAPDRVEDAMRGADLIVYATPLEATRELLLAHAGVWDEGAVVTDVCSLKVPVLEAARAAGFAGRFVGGHPMAGSHRSGFAHARGDLYRNATVWLVGGGAEAPLERVAALWRSLGAEPRPIDADAHDRLMAWASHLPQAAAWALAAALAEHGTPASVLGPGGRDATRLAESSTRLWLELLRWNREEDLAALDALAASLASLRDAVASGEDDRLEELLTAARTWKVDR